MHRILQTLLLSSLVLLTACATNIKASKTTNPAPTEKFSAYSQFELKPITMAAAYSADGANQKAMAKIQEHMNDSFKPSIDAWNKSGNTASRVLVIEPFIKDIKFIAIGARIFAGPFAGSSAVVMQVKYTDKATGKVIAEPEFFQRASAMSGAFTMGGQDNAMLSRIVSLATKYNTNNYDKLVGGETGAVPEKN
jgi:hypothetical protein